MLKAIYDQVKQVKPTAQVGWHVDHEPSTWDLIYRAEMSYAEMAPYSDFIKIILYHDVAAPRVRNWYLERLRRGVFSEVPLEESLNLYYDLFGYDKSAEPKLNEMTSPRFFAGIRVPRNRAQRGLGGGQNQNLCRHRLQRARRAAEYRSGKCLQSQCSAPSTPAAAGIVVSREYEEMRLPNLNAVGRAVRELASKKS